MSLLHPSPTSLAHPHGGLLFPLEMFRPTVLAKVLGEYFVSKARNVLDAKMMLVKHPRTQLCLLRIVGSVVGDDEGAFWRENADLVLLFSRIIPRQAFLYYVTYKPERREGFVVAQQGQTIMADEVTRDRLPPEATEADWPVARLCEQLASSAEEVRLGFPGATQIHVSLIDPEGDDRELLTALIKGDESLQADDGDYGPEDDFDGDEGIVDAEIDAAPTQAAPSSPSAGPRGPASAPAAPSRPAKISVAEDERRRAAERNAEQQARAAAVAAIHADLAYVTDDLGIVVAPKASLEDTDVLRTYAQREVHGDLPAGIPSSLARQLQGKRVDFVIPVEFLSEVFVGHNPLNRPAFEASAKPVAIGGHLTPSMEVLAPRLGPGTLFRRGSKNVFVSRTEAPYPESLIEALFQAL
jgi:hypothetical protein